MEMWVEEQKCEVCGTTIELDVYGASQGEVEGYFGRRLKERNHRGLQRAKAKSCPLEYENPYSRINWAGGGMGAWRKEYGSHLSYDEEERLSDELALKEWKSKPWWKRGCKPKLCRDYNPYWG